MSLLLLAGAAIVRGGWAGTLELAVRGRAPEYAIVRAADASPSVKYAAEELRDFTERFPERQSCWGRLTKRQECRFPEVRLFGEAALLPLHLLGKAALLPLQNQKIPSASWCAERACM